MKEERDWLEIAKNSFRASTTYVDANYRKKWDDALAMFQSEHPRGSKYHTEAYKYRSKLFRPKTRSVIRRHEAAAAAAFFSNQDVVEVDAVQSGNAEAQMSAELMKEVLNYRLTKTIPWFLTLIGGFQDALTVGVVCSYQYWKYKGETTLQSQPAIDETGRPIIGPDGQPVMRAVKAVKTLQDEPCVELIPVENIRIDPGASWIDPINTSPYVIRLIPMYISDIKAMMSNVDPKTNAPKWKTLSDEEIVSSMSEDFDATRQAREGKRQDSKAQKQDLTDFDIVWVHENIVRIENEEMVYFTMGTEHLLTEPTPLIEVYFHGERPYTMGAAVIETHKNYPNSIAMLGEMLQREANDVQNQRMDNVKLVLNKRYIVKRGAQVDLKSLVKNVAGSITLANDPVGDVHQIEFPDVTGSSYQEQDRINVDYDELTGNFSNSSVQTNRTLNDTVGGMKLLSGGANALTEYTLRVFTETWVEKVLSQLVKLEQAYESDETVLAIAADKAKLWQKYGKDKVTDDMMKHDLVLTVNVGMNATDPTQRMNHFVGALMAVANVAKAQVPQIDLQAVTKEIFGITGYKDGARFLQQQNGQDPKLAQATQIIQQLHQQLQQATDQNNLKLKMNTDKIQAEMQQHTQELRAEMAQHMTQLQVDSQANSQSSQLAVMLEKMKEDSARGIAELNGLVQMLIHGSQLDADIEMAAHAETAKDA